MRIGLYAATLGAMEQENKLAVISNNLANASTPGFKKDILHFKDFMQEETTTNFEQGAIKSTGNPMDIAISGKGYLRVQSDQGILYTRAGNLTINNDKVLVTQQGWPVLGQNGPIQVRDTVGSDIRFDPNGQVYDGTNAVDTLNLATFPADTQLEKVKGGYFTTATGSPEPLPDSDSTIRQGALEEPNFDMVQEMVNLINTSRLFESYQKTIQTIDHEESLITSKSGLS